MRIRAATPADAEGIAEVQSRAWRAAYRGQVPDDHLDGLVASSLLPNLRWTLENPPDYWRMWVADLDGAIVGFASTSPSADVDATAEVAEVTAVYVDPDHVRSGIGSDLLAHVLDDLSGRARRVTLWILEGNAAGRAFFETRGWEPDGSRTSELVGDRLLPAVRYARDLPPGGTSA